MAHHNSTPRSVLDAPVSVPIVIVEYQGMNREERRRRGVPSEKRLATNQTYRKPVAS